MLLSGSSSVSGFNLPEVLPHLPRPRFSLQTRNSTVMADALLANRCSVHPDGMRVRHELVPPSAFPML